MMPVMYIALYGGDNIVQLKKIADDTIVSRLLRIEGVASVYETRIRKTNSYTVDPTNWLFTVLVCNKLLASFNGKLKLSGGSVNQGNRDYIIRTEVNLRIYLNRRFTNSTAYRW